MDKSIILERFYTTGKGLDLGNQAGIILVSVAIAPIMELSPPFVADRPPRLSYPPSANPAWAVVDHFPTHDRAGDLSADL